MSIYEAKYLEVEAEPVELGGNRLMAFSADGRAHVMDADAFGELYEERTRKVKIPPKACKPSEPHPIEQRIPHVGRQIEQSDSTPIVGPRPPVKKLPAQGTLAHQVLLAVRKVGGNADAITTEVSVSSCREHVEKASVQTSLSELKNAGLIKPLGNRRTRTWSLA